MFKNISTFSLSFVLLFSAIAFAAEPHPSPPVHRIPDQNLGCGPGMKPDCGCEYWQCDGMSGPTPNGFILCGDLNGDAKKNLQDCIGAVREICTMAGYPGVRGYSCYDYPRTAWAQSDAFLEFADSAYSETPLRD